MFGTLLVLFSAYLKIILMMVFFFVVGILALLGFGLVDGYLELELSSNEKNIARLIVFGCLFYGAIWLWQKYQNKQPTDE